MERIGRSVAARVFEPRSRPRRYPLVTDAEHALALTGKRLRNCLPEVARISNRKQYLDLPGLVRTVGIEPTLPIGKKILSLQRLPFRHVRSASPGDGRFGQDYSAVTSCKFSLSRISLPGLK